MRAAIAVVFFESKRCAMTSAAEGQRSNFFLRRAIPFVGRTPTKEWQEATDQEEYEKMSTLEEGGKRGKVNKELPDTKIESDANHKTVIYFGDSIRREKEAKKESATWISSSLVQESIANFEKRAKSRSIVEVEGDFSKVLNVEVDNANFENEEQKIEGVENRKNLNDGDESGGCEFVISVKPCREDVLRIEEDETKLEDYWSLPGDTTGFRADWSFVQQWRLRG